MLARKPIRGIFGRDGAQRRSYHFAIHRHYCALDLHVTEVRASPRMAIDKRHSIEVTISLFKPGLLPVPLAQAHSTHFVCAGYTICHIFLFCSCPWFAYQVGIESMTKRP